MLMRNLNPPYLCNGTKLIIKSMRKNVIEGIIVSGQGIFVNCFFVIQKSTTPIFNKVLVKQF